MMRGSYAILLTAVLTGGGGYVPAQVWEGPVAIDAGNGLPAHDPRIALAADGSALVVFRQSDAEYSRVWANHYRGSGWGEAAWDGALRIDVGAAVYAWSAPSVAFGPNGRAIAVFAHGNESLVTHIFANRYNGGQWSDDAWDGPVRIDSSLSLFSTQPSISISAGGEAIATFTQLDIDLTTSACASRYSGAGWGDGAWEAAKRIDSNAGDFASGPRFAFGPDGTGIAVFAEGPAQESYRIHANRYNTAAWWLFAWDGALRIDAEAAVLSVEPSIAFDAAGRAIAAFTQNDGMLSHTFAVRYETSGSSGWVEPERIDADTAFSSYEARLSTDGVSRVMAVFRQSDGTRDRIYANLFDGTSWRGAVAIDGDGGGDARAPRIAVSPGGQALALFLRSDGTHDHVYANFYGGAGWGEGAWLGVRRIDADSGGSASQPEIAYDAGGNAIAVFRQSDGENLRIYANRFVTSPVRINFQPEGAETPVGYVADTGSPQSQEGYFGWRSEVRARSHSGDRRR